MEIDSEKLLRLIEERSPIYNFKDKEHANKVTVLKLWEEVASEMDCSVLQCKGKWASLRNAYCRYLREKRCRPIVSNNKPKKKWYMAKSMEFLKEYINPYRSMSNSLDTPIVSEGFKNETMTSNSIVTLDENSQSTTSTNRFSPVPSKSSKALLSELETEPMIDFLQSTIKETPQESGDTLFFKSLLADYEKLSSRRQRSFKMHMLSKMFELQEEQEKDTSHFQSASYNGTFLT